MKDNEYGYNSEKQEKPLYRKWWFILLVIVLAAAIIYLRYGGLFTASDSEDSTDYAEEATVESEDASVEEEPEDEDTEEEENGEVEIISSDSEQTGEESIEEQVLYDKDGIVITATGEVDVTSSQYQIELLVENGSSDDIYITPEYSSVNGYMIDMSIHSEIPAGRESYSELKIDLDDLEDSGVSTIMEIEFCLEIWDPESWAVYDLSDPVTIQTGAYGTETQEYDDSGAVLYDEGGITITFRHLKIGSSTSSLVFYLENDSGQDVNISTEDVAINDTMLSSTMFCSVVDGKKAVDHILVDDDVLAEMGLSDVNDIEKLDVSFSITDAETSTLIAETELYSISTIYVEDNSVDSTVEAEEPTDESTLASDEIIDEQVIYNQNGIVITATGVEVDDYYYLISLFLENNSGYDIVIDIDYGSSSVNGCMQYMSLYCDILSGKSAYDEIRIVRGNLEASGIETVMEIEFCLEIFTQETYDDIDLTDPITLTTAAYDTATQEFNDTGTELYSDYGIRIVYTNPSELSSSSSLVLYSENESGQNVYIDLTLTITSPSSITTEEVMIWISNGKKSVEEIVLDSDILSDLGIDSIEGIGTIEASFSIQDRDNYTTIDSKTGVVLYVQ